MRLFLAMANSRTHAAFLSANLASPFTRLLYTHENLSNIVLSRGFCSGIRKLDKLPYAPALDQDLIGIGTQSTAKKNTPCG